MTNNRGTWGSWLEFMLSALGTLVGLGNVWRFPYICYRNGGGAFLLPFTVTMLVCGIPILFLEMIYCQYSSLGPGRVWVICPLFKGVGFGMMVNTFIVSIYYAMIMAWTLYYLVLSFSPNLPWSSCGHHDPSGFCRTVSNLSMLWGNETEKISDILLQKSNLTYPSLAEQYWFEDVLQLSPGLDQMGEVRWQLLACLTAVWVIVFLCLVKGIKSLGKVVYVAALLPYFILTALLIRGCLLPGAAQGLIFFLVPDWSKLAQFEVWRSAAIQVFFSVGLGFGLIPSLASYNKFNNNCKRDAMILPLLDFLTSVYAGLVIFAFLGYMAHTSGKDIDSVIDQGPGLAFIAYPAALSTLPLPQIWSVLFFLMFFCVGLDSQFVHVQSLSAALIDCFPDQPLAKRRALLTTTICLVIFLLGIPLTSQGGLYLLNLLDWYVTSFALLLIVFIEIIALAWIYGTRRLSRDFQAMSGQRLSWIWNLVWRFITPVCVLVLWFTGVFDFVPIDSIYPGYPSWANSLGLVISMLPLLPIPFKMVWTICRRQGTFMERLRTSVEPTAQWGPAKQENQTLLMERLVV